MKMVAYIPHFWFKPKSNVRKKSLLLIGIFALLHMAAVAAGTVEVAPEWKAHFKARLVIENCVFKRITFAEGNTNLYQVRFQEGAFVMREISKPADADLDHIAGGTTYAGRWGSNYWAIDTDRVLKEFPDAEKMIKDYKNPDVSLIDAPRSTLLAALYYGFPSLDLASIEWVDESTFTASGIRGGRLRCKIVEAVGGLPTLLEWHSEVNPEQQAVIQYEYGQKLDLPYYPSEILVRGQFKGKTFPVVVYRILSLKTSPEPLQATWFDSTRYFASTNLSGPNAAQVLIVTENQLYYRNERGSYDKVLTKLTADGTSRGRANPNVIRVFTIGFAVVSAIGLYFVWKLAKKTEKTKKRTNQ